VRPRVVLAYSGGLDTSVAVAWLQERGYDVVAATIDVGQPGDLARTRDRAGRLGAVESHLVDAKEDFVSDFVFPALAMNALYQGRYPLASALSRPLIARVLAKIAAETGAAAVAHGCTGKGNDQVRFEVSLSTLAPDREVLAPVREWGMTRSEAVAYAQRRGLPIETMRSSPYSIDENLWGRSIECGVLEDPWSPAPPEVFELTVDPADAAGSARDVVVAFEGGAPTALYV
jgi:argininosuccinate synthase